MQPSPLIFIVVILLGIFLRIFPRLLRQCVIDSDTVYHLLAAEQIRNNRFRVPQYLQGFILQMPYTYPPLFHYFLALMPKHRRERVEPFLGALIDTLHILTVSLILWQASQLAGFFSGWQIGLMSMVSMLTFLTYPALLNATPLRVYMGTPRPVGEWLFSVTMFSLWIYSMTGCWVWFVFAVLATALLLLCSKFAAQVFVFSSVFMAAWIGRVDTLLLIPLGLLTAILISKGHYLKVLEGQVQHSIFYQRYIIKSHPIKERNQFRDLLQLPGEIFRNPNKVFQTLYEKNTFSALLLRNPYLLLVVYFWLLFPSVFLNEFRFLSGWLLSCILAFVVTSLRPFLFLGEAERYVEYAVPAMSVLISAFLVEYGGKASWLIWLTMVIYSVIFAVGNHLILIRRCDKQKREELCQAIMWLSQLPENHRILPIPAHFLGRMIAKETHHQALFFSDNLNEKFLSGEEFLRIFPQYPFPNTDLEYFIKRYRIDLVICEKRYILHIAQQGLHYDFSNWLLAFENSEYAIFRRQAV